MTSEGAGAEVAGRRLVHLATTDMSLALLLGPQLRAFADAGMEVIGASAPGPYTGELATWGIRHEPVQHATRSNSVRQDVQALTELVRMFRRLRPDIVHTHNPKPGVYGRLAARLAGVPVVVNTVHGLYATPDGPAPAPDARLRPGTRRLGVLASRARPKRGGPRDAGSPAGAGTQARSAGQRGGPRALQAPARARRDGAALHGCGRWEGARRSGRPARLGEGVCRALRGSPAAAAQPPRGGHRRGRAERPCEEQRALRGGPTGGRGHWQRLVPGRAEGRRGPLPRHGPLRPAFLPGGLSTLGHGSVGLWCAGGGHQHPRLPAGRRPWRHRTAGAGPRPDRAGRRVGDPGPGPGPAADDERSGRDPGPRNSTIGG